MPGPDIAQGRRRPVILSSAARTQVLRLGKRAQAELLAELERLAAAGPGGQSPTVTSFGERGYKALVAGDLLAVFREMTPDEVMKQGYEERLTRRGGIFVVQVIPTNQSPSPSGEGRVEGR